MLSVVQVARWRHRIFAFSGIFGFSSFLLVRGWQIADPKIADRRSKDRRSQENPGKIGLSSIVVVFIEGGEISVRNRLGRYVRYYVLLLLLLLLTPPPLSLPS